MLKSLMVAGGIALSAIAMTSGAADAKTRVGVYFGVPFYDYQVNPDWRYYDGYGWYDYGQYGDFDRVHHADYRHHNRSNFTLYFGVPFYQERMGPGWRYYDGYGWYDYDRYGDFRHRHMRNGFMSCGQAARLVDRAGFDHVRVVECNGRMYTFRAVNPRGRVVTVLVDSRTGSIMRR